MTLLPTSQIEEELIDHRTRSAIGFTLTKFKYTSNWQSSIVVVFFFCVMFFHFWASALPFFKQLMSWWFVLFCFLWSEVCSVVWILPCNFLLHLHLLIISSIFFNHCWHVNKLDLDRIFAFPLDPNVEIVVLVTYAHLHSRSLQHHLPN